MNTQLGVILLLFMSIAIVNGLPPIESEEVTSDGTTSTKKGTIEDCNSVFSNNDLNFTSFWRGAAHGLHSLSLEEIRHFFEAEAPVENKIPVVNSNLSSENTILFNAPLWGYDEDFKTMALKVLSYFMLNDKPDFYQQGVNIWEKIGHQYHMHEIYAAAAPIYRKMKDNPPTDPDLCPCVNDVTGNGILKQMVNIAKTLKYFARQPRATAKTKEKYKYEDGTKIKNKYREKRSLQERKRRDTNEPEENLTQLEQAYLADRSIENADKLLDVNPWHTNTLTGPEQWIQYEAMLAASMLEEEELNDFSVFMYCKLNEPNLDHVKDLFE